jgi:hypothetical protein
MLAWARKNELQDSFKLGGFWSFLGKFDEVARNKLLKWARDERLTDSFNRDGFWSFLGKFDEEARDQMLAWARKNKLQDSFKRNSFWSFLAKFNVEARETRLSAVTSTFEKCKTSQGPFKDAVQGYDQFWSFCSDDEFAAKAEFLADHAGETVLQITWWLTALEYCYKTPRVELRDTQLKERVGEAKSKMEASNLRSRENCVKCPICRIQVSATFSWLKAHVAGQRCKDENECKAINMIKSGSCEHGGTTLDVSYCLSNCEDANHNHASKERCKNVALKKVKKTSKAQRSNVKDQSGRPQGAGTAKRRRNFMDRQKEKRQVFFHYFLFEKIKLYFTLGCRLHRIKAVGQRG